jgi:hypothetical protein
MLASVARCQEPQLFVAHFILLNKQQTIASRRPRTEIWCGKFDMILAHFSKSESIFVISGSKLAMRPKIRAQLVVFVVADKPDKVAGNLTMRFFTFKRL